jgi:valyl-tRNA synthetase
VASERAADPAAEKQFHTIQDLVVLARNAKAELGLQEKRPSAQAASEDLRVLELFEMHQAAILRLAGLGALSLTRSRLAGEGVGYRITPAFGLRLFHGERVDHEGERSRLQKEKEKLERQLAQVKKQLENEEFLRRAPQEVVRGAEHRHTELSDHYRKVLESLERLG